MIARKEMTVLPRPSALKQKPWNLRNWTNERRVEICDDELRATASPKQVGMDSGTGFFATPDEFPKEDATVTFEVYFPANFQWKKGGKLGLGLGIGDGLETATGGDWQKTCGSVRCMWREEGEAIGYLYLPLEGKRGSEAVHRAQTPDVRKALDGTISTKTGLNVWYTKDHPTRAMRFKRGRWNEVSLRVKLNTPGKNDGLLELKVNGSTRKLDTVCFRKSRDIKLNGIIFHYFFGGASKEWMCTSPQEVKFRRMDFS